MLNLIAVVKVTHVKINVVADLIKPLIAAIICGAAAWASYGLLSEYALKSVSYGSSIALIISIIIAVVVYAVTVLVIKGVVKEDVESLPAGEKIAKLLEKYKLLG